MQEARIDAEIEKLTKDYPKLYKVWNILRNDAEITALLDEANTVAISRLGFTDHGRVHAKIVALNAIRIYNILQRKGIKANIIKEKSGNEEDVKVALLLGAYFHDCGMAVTRQNHELFSAILAQPIVKRILSEVYRSYSKKWRILGIVLESAVCHMGNFKPASLEAGIVSVADGTDLTEGRARLPFKLGKEDIHSFSSMAIKKVKIKDGVEKPVRIEVYMNDIVGVFQVEEILLRKVRNSNFEKYVEVVANVKGRKIIKYK